MRGIRPGPAGTPGFQRFIPACAGNTAGADSPPSRYRFIPACAGNTSTSCLCSCLPPVHPRVCGEYGEARFPLAGVGGSSPRVRGIRPAPSEAQGRDRFIPACAGNTASSACPRPARPVHPRVCGEYSIFRLPSASETGSSPRVRGIRQRRKPAGGRTRFIPACAGNTPARPWWRSSPTVHPRVCGEYREVPGLEAEEVGSSPRVRGIRHGETGSLYFRRFIPACAGNTAPGPRDGMPHRFIPACAGNTFPQGVVAPVPPVHPRVCGEYTTATR